MTADTRRWSAVEMAGHIELVEKLSLHEQFRLVEIAHETKDCDIRKAALTVLQKYLNPLVRMVNVGEQQ